MVLKTAPCVLYKGLKEAIGTPEDYFRNKAKNHFPDYDTRYAKTERKESSVGLQIPARATPRLEESKVRGEVLPDYDISDQVITSVKDLRQGSTGWAIRVTVQRKSDVKAWRSVVA